MRIGAGKVWGATTASSESDIAVSVIWEIILRDFWRAILRSRVTPTAAGMEMPECEHLNPHLFEASDHAIYRTRRFFRNSNDHYARRAVNPKKFFEFFYGPNPQRQHVSRLLPRDRAVSGLV